MARAQGPDIADWVLRHFDVDLPPQRISEMMIELGFSSRETRPTPRARQKSTFIPEMVDAISDMRARINEAYDIHEVLAEDEIMMWNSGTANTSYGLTGGY